MIGFRLEHELDLLSQEKIVKTMFRRVANTSKTTVAGSRCTPALAWTFGPSTRIKVITGRLRLGILRKPVLTNNILMQITNIIMEVQSKSSAHASFGIGYKVHIANDRPNKWIASSISILGQTQQQLAQIRRQAQGREALGVAVQVEARDAVLTHDDMEFCHFRHTTTSANAKGKIQWYVNPPWSYWAGVVPGGVRLCSACSQRARRLANQKKFFTLREAHQPIEELVTKQRSNYE